MSARCIVGVWWDRLTPEEVGMRSHLPTPHTRRPACTDRGGVAPCTPLVALLRCLQPVDLVHVNALPCTPITMAAALQSSTVFQTNPYEGHPNLSELEAEVLWQYAQLSQSIKEVCTRVFHALSSGHLPRGQGTRTLTLCCASS